MGNVPTKTSNGKLKNKYGKQSKTNELNDSENQYEIHEICKALYDYKKGEDDEMSFLKGDTLEILLKKQNGEWFQCCNMRTKEIGLVPYNFVEMENGDDPFLMKPYYFNINRIKAENKLQNMGFKHGTFLIRPSDKKPNSLALSVRVFVKKIWQVKHFLIINENGRFFIGTSPKFDDLDGLIGYLSSPNKLMEVVLTDPIPPEIPKIEFDEFEVDRKNFITEEKLGQGNFGEVRKARWGSKACTHVAIKVVKAGKMTNEAFIQEAKVMHELNHENIMRLLAVCTEPRDQDIYIVTEYMEKGDLLSYMRSEDGLRSEFNKLNHFIVDVCNGMKYLEKEKYVHCDLKASNILVNEELTAKVADFGLTKFINESADASEQKKFPIRWTAPEAANSGIFTTKSDVWSFGILIYEVITYGDIPYKDMSNDEVRNCVIKIVDGYRMKNPHDMIINVRRCFCPTVLYNIMKECWNKVADTRPTFESLHNRLQRLDIEDTSYD